MYEKSVFVSFCLDRAIKSNNLAKFLCLFGKKVAVEADLKILFIQSLSIESACQELQEAPSGNRLREVLVAS